MKEGGTGLHKTIREINLVYKGLMIKVLNNSTNYSNTPPFW